MAMQYEFDRTKDPVTGRVEREKLWPAIEYTDQLKQDLRAQMSSAKATIVGWTERGPNSDIVGSSNGNTRPGNGVASGRIRSAMVDLNDATGNTVFAGGVNGGLWKTTNVSSSPATWTPINDKFSNLAITSICQDPKRPDTIYFSTGEANFNGDAVQGDGIFRSLDGGLTWLQLASTTSSGSGGAFNFCTKILCDTLGNVYVGTRSGLKRSTNQGSSWTDITPNGTNSFIGDIVISSTGRLHATMGLSITSTAYYRYTDIPATVTAGTWTSATTAPPTANIDRILLACKGDTLIALPSDATSDDVASIYRSTDGGANWSAAGSTPAFTSGQGWYCLAAAINPSNGQQFLVGSLDCYRSTNSGGAWTKVSNWVGSTLSYVHADQHQAIWYNAGAQNRVIVVCDGGLFLSTDGGQTFTDRNVGLRIKQFYSCAIHPSTTNYLLGGAQDNGCHQFNNAGLSSTVEVTGGDGAFVHIDQDQPQFQFGSYVFNQYRRSTNSGSSWSSVNISASTGQFINPTDYDNAANIMYCSDAAGSYRRWTNPQSGATSAVVSITALNSASVTAVAVSPNTSNRIFLGAGGRVVRVDNANTISSGSAGTSLGSVTSGTISSINLGASDDTIIVTVASYSGTQVFYTNNGTAATPTWVSKDGNLPNVPARWALLIPGSVSKRALVATETGVWSTVDITAATVVWLPDVTFPNVRTDMLQIRTSDGLVAAATHGRGMWTASLTDLFPSALPVTEFSLQGKSSGRNVALDWTFRTARDAVYFDVERSVDGVHFNSIATIKAGTGYQSYNYIDEQAPAAHVYYRIKSYDQMGLTYYSNMAAMGGGATTNVDISVYPNPCKDNLTVAVRIPDAASLSLQVFSMTGAKVYEGPRLQLAAGMQTIPLNLVNLPAGSYLAVAILNGQRYTARLVKQ